MYGIGRDPVLKEFEIKVDDKYLVIRSDCVFDVHSKDDVPQIAVNLESANDDASRIRNTAFGYGSTANIFLIVFEIDEKKKKNNF